MQYLLVVDDVDAAAAVCDHVDQRLGPEASVHAVAVLAEDGSGRDDADPIDERDRREALNVVDVRLVPTSVETEVLRGDPFDVVTAAVERVDPDEVVLGLRGDRAEGVADAIDGSATVVDVPDGA